MKRQKQIHEDDCTAACIATLLEIPLETMPGCFRGRYWDWMKQQRWLMKHHGVMMFGVEIEISKPNWKFGFAQLPKNQLCIASMPQQADRKGIGHSVVALLKKNQLEIVFDPHPQRVRGYPFPPRSIDFLVRPAC